MNSKYDEILDNLVNGNISDFREAVKELSKYEIVELISYVKSGNFGEYPKVHNILIALQGALS